MKRKIPVVLAALLLLCGLMVIPFQPVQSDKAPRRQQSVRYTDPESLGIRSDPVKSAPADAGPVKFARLPGKITTSGQLYGKYMNRQFGTLYTESLWRDGVTDEATAAHINTLIKAMTQELQQMEKQSARVMGSGEVTDAGWTVTTVSMAPSEKVLSELRKKLASELEGIIPKDDLPVWLDGIFGAMAFPAFRLPYTIFVRDKGEDMGLTMQGKAPPLTTTFDEKTKTVSVDVPMMNPDGTLAEQKQLSYFSWTYPELVRRRWDYLVPR